MLIVFTLNGWPASSGRNRIQTSYQVLAYLLLLMHYQITLPDDKACLKNKTEPKLRWFVLMTGVKVQTGEEDVVV